MVVIGEKMKLFADYKTENGYKNINIWYIYNSYKEYTKTEGYITFEKYYDRFFKHRLFSTHRVNKIQMMLVKKTPYGDSFFRYYGNINDKGKSESITHSTYKDIIKELYVLNLVVNDKVIKLYVSYSDIEYAFIANGKYYCTDVFINFYKSNPEEYFYKWNGKLCIEIKYTHPVTKEKAQDFYSQGIPVFEHSISRKLLMSEHTNSEKEIIKQKNYIKDLLSEKIYGKLLSDPKSKEYVMIERLKKENVELQEKNAELKKNNAFLLNLNNIQSNQIVQMQQKTSELEKYKKEIEKHKFIKFIIGLLGIK